MPHAALKICWGVAVAAVTAGAAVAETPQEKAQRLIERGLDYLASQQSPEGGWLAQRGAPAITALALKAFAQHPTRRDERRVADGFRFLLSFQVQSGGIYQDTLASYNTATAISALAAARNPAFQPAIDRAVAYLRSLQWQEGMVLPSGETVQAGDPRIGGWGYGSRGRPDGSNTSMALDALIDAGLSREDPVFKAAAQFVTRMQNLSATNDQPWATNLPGGGDGGFIYSPARGGESFAGEYVDSSGTRRFHSYGSMTYAGMRSLLYANLTREDPRVQAAWGWISRNWSLTENPGMRNAGPDAAADGLFYYFHAMARALKEYGEPNIPTRPTPVDWRVALVERLDELQRPDGSWKGGRAYMEELEVLVTAYCVLALQEVLKDFEARPPAVP